MRYRHELIFWLITFLYVLSRFIIFNGFNGSDDLHYAMLSDKLLKGTYNPFEPNDIFSGRALLVALQALIYKSGGISVFTTAAGTILAVILSCRLTIFRLLRLRSNLSVFLSASLFYFNPALTQATIGILPDAYIMLAGTIVMVILKKYLVETGEEGKRTTASAFMLSLVIAGSLLIKETAIVFLPTVMILAFLFRRGRSKLYIAKILAFFTIFGVLFLVCYCYFAGDPFIRLVQIRNSSYPNNCSFALRPVSDLLVRLTYGVWQNFIAGGFYPVVFAFATVLTLVITKFFNRNRIQGPGTGDEGGFFYTGTIKNFELLSFVVILVVGLFFPFSLNGYEPLCANPRHFLFLIPFAVVQVVNYLSSSPGKRSLACLTIFAGLAFSVCMVSTQNKWQWMIYLMFVAAFFIRFVGFPKFNTMSTSAIALISIASIFESLFFLRSTWFNDLQVVHARLQPQNLALPVINKSNSSGKGKADTITKSITYYFADHDNMMHWKLLSRFNEVETSYFNLDPQPFKIYKRYYQIPEMKSFQAGWLIINKQYPRSSDKLLRLLSSPQTLKLLPTIIHSGAVDAYLIDDPAQIEYVRSIIGESHG